MFSRSCEYGLQAILYIALHHDDGRSVGLKEIAESQQIPPHYLSKILQLLVKNKILNSNKGPTGGFSFRVDPSELDLLQIVSIIDGDDIFDRCGIGLKDCTDKDPCPIHNEYKKVKEKIKEVLSIKTVAELCEDVRNGKAIVAYK